jgi:exodeoxyribonuclease V gamma subunit
VEVLLDVLLDCLQRDPSLHPHQIAIMAPSLDRYAPLIEAVLASTPLERRIPITLADGRADRLHPLIQRFLWLLRLPQAQFTRMEVLGLLECPQLRARFDLGDEGLEWLRAWAVELGVVRGLNAAQREALGEGAASAHTWAAAVERLLMGQAVGDDGGLLDGVAPFASGDGADAALALGVLWRLLRELDRWRLRLAAPAAGGDTVALLEQLFDAFFLVDASDQSATDASEAVRDALAAIADELILADVDASPGIDALIAALEESLAQPARWQRFLGEGVTVCAMVPLRSVPFRIIAVLGLDDGVFPRRTPPAGFDLQRRAPRPGDRRPRDDDRQLLLDTLLAAREHLHLSYVGMDPTDAAPRPPAAPLAELIDTLRQAYGQRWTEIAPRVLFRHPLVPFAADSFSAGAGSFAQQWWPAQLAERDGWRAPRPFVQAAMTVVDAADASVDVARLLRHFRNPASAFLCDRLRLSRARWIEDQAGEEAHSVDHRAARVVLGRMLDATVRGVAIGDLVARITAEGQLPDGLAGQVALQDLSERFDAAIDLVGSARLQRAVVAIDVRLDQISIAGQLIWLGDGKGPLALGVDEPDAATLLALALTRELLIRQCVLEPHAPCSYIEVPLNKRPRRHRMAPLADAQHWLTGLAEAWTSGQSSPLPLPQRSAWSYARVWVKKQDHAEAVEASLGVWQGNDRARGESQDSDHAIAFRGIEVPELDAFAHWARRIYAPLAAAVTAGPRA